MGYGRKLKKENYTAVADLMLVSFERDLADFTKVFKTIDAAFLEAFKKANQDLKNKASAVVRKENQKNTTQDLYAKADAFAEKLGLLKIYAKRANMTLPLVQETITALKSRNIEKVVNNARELHPFLTQNAEKISDMPKDFLADFPDFITAFESKNTEQNSLITQNKQATAVENPLYETLYKYISEVAEAGKVVYKGSTKKEEYTISKIVSKLEATLPKKDGKEVKAEK